MEFNLLLFQRHVTTPRITIARLTNTADIDHHFVATQTITVVNIWWAKEFIAIGEYSGNMGMPLKAILLNELKYSGHLLRVVDIFRKNIFVQRTPCRAMDKQEITFTVISLQLTKKIPTPYTLLFACFSF